MRALDNELPFEADETCAVGCVTSLDSHPRSGPQVSLPVHRESDMAQVSGLYHRETFDKHHLLNKARS